MRNILDLEELYNQKTQIESEVYDLKSSIDDLQSEIQELEGTLASFNAKENTPENEAKISEIESDIEEKRIDILDKSSELTDLQDSLKPYEGLESKLGMDLMEAHRSITAIEESDFEEYCHELCKDIGDIPKDLPWYIKNAIDWEQVANSIRVGYSEFEWDGGTYLWIKE